MCLATVSCALADEEITELKVEVLHKPEECSRPAARADMLTMHYKGTLLSGAEFDSRLVLVLLCQSQKNIALHSH